MVGAPFSTHVASAQLSPSMNITTFPPELPDLTLATPPCIMIWKQFSVNKAQALPPHRPYNCAIRPLCPPVVYSMAMESYIHGSLAAGLIRPSSSLVGADFSFVKKKDNPLFLCWLQRSQWDNCEEQISPSPLTPPSNLFTEPRFFKARLSECISPYLYQWGTCMEGCLQHSSGTFGVLGHAVRPH